MVRNWIGTIEEETVAKYAARLGLAFSSSTPTLSLSFSQKDVIEIPDIQTTSGVQYCFSDGVGKISLECATKVANLLQLEEVPSAYQIRFAGYKGVLSVDNRLPSPTAQICLRPSMRKYHSTYEVLEIIRPATFSSCYLNRQIIMLLSTLGVEDSIFMELQQDMLRKLEGMMINHQNARDVLEMNDQDTILSHILQLMDAGFSIQEEPYLRGLLSAIGIQQCKELKTKARIYIKEGGFFMGVMDEYGVLEYGQVFISMETKQLGSKILQGNVLVTKNPCLDTGMVISKKTMY